MGLVHDVVVVVNDVQNTRLHLCSVCHVLSSSSAAFQRVCLQFFRRFMIRHDVGCILG